MTTPQRSQPARRPEPQQPAGPVPALARAFGLLGRGWTGLILAALAKGPIGFTQVRERVPGISDSMLVDRLQELTTVDLVARTVGPRRDCALRPTIPTAGCTWTTHGR
ncbi:helix-turn-helix domain-containing protein [Streptomyces sp. NPDC006332]|uniref:winged helix-turn-helix transcriptional regulator n=1 Tax=Streptomyces sp. NPDC006332 TaxID=3155456 RepID=UPI0033B15934